MLILTLVCVAWLEIIGIQSARKEARRREAVEQLAGMMDAFMYWCKMTYNAEGYDANYENHIAMGNFCLDKEKIRLNEIVFKPSTNDPNSPLYVNSVFDTTVSPIGYRLSVVSKSELRSHALFGDNWGAKIWLVGELYDRNGSLRDAGQPYFILPVYLGIDEE